MLFADVVGSMRLAAALDPERLQAIMHELFNRGATVVQRFRGTVDKFTGDGLMALFGAPVALEDHALRACIAGLELQSVAKELAAEVLRTDGVDLKVRVGLNSGDVIAGEIGSGPGSYTAIGHPVGMAQRMESAAPPDGVLCSESTARLVHRSALLGPLINVRIKGFDDPVPAREVLGVRSDRMVLGRNEGELIGRDQEVQLMKTWFYAGYRGPIGVIGETGLGKTRFVAEFTDFAAANNVRIVAVRCEAHTTGVGFRALGQLVRAMFGVEGLTSDEARIHVTKQIPGFDPESDDARILFDAMGLHDGSDPVEPTVDGRWRRLAEIMARALHAHPMRTVFILEDLQWIDSPSDDVIAAFTTLADTTKSMFVTTYRPEFHGAMRQRATNTIVLRALTFAQALQAVFQVLGNDPSVSQLGQQIADTAAGNPLFAEEIIRDLADRGVLKGGRGGYHLSAGVEHICVPPTVQAVIAARIDRLDPQTKSILNAAAVIGSHFDADTLQMVQPLTNSVDVAELLAAELIDQTEFVPVQRFCFHHPLVRTVAYESQLQATRARTHVTLAEAIQKQEPFSDEKAALIAAHLEAAGDFSAAYHWHMRAADWLRPRDLPAARVQWDGARRIADKLPGDSPEVLRTRIAPRTLLVSTMLYVRDEFATEETYRELYELSVKTGDRASLAIGMAGRSFSMTANDSRADKARPLALELRAMAHHIPCDSKTQGILLNSAAFTNFALGNFRSALAIADEIIALPLDRSDAEIAGAFSLRGFVLRCLGDTRRGSRTLQEALDLCRALHPVRHASVQVYVACLAALGVVEATSVIDGARAAWQAAESFGDICGIVMARWAYGSILIRIPGSYEDGIAILRSTRATADEHRFGACALNTVRTDLAVDSARTGHVDEAIDEIRNVFDSALSGFPVLAMFPAEALVDLLLSRGSEADVTEAKRVVTRWRDLDLIVPALHLWRVRAQARIAQAEGADGTYRRFSAGYLRLCEQLSASCRLEEARRMAAADAQAAVR